MLIDTILCARACKANVFARTSPKHKLRLAEVLQTEGTVVAMPGDGVNGAPSLKRADVSVAIGQKGTEPAKQEAEIVLADDNFATIAAVVPARIHPAADAGAVRLDYHGQRRHAGPAAGLRVARARRRACLCSACC